MTESVEFVAKSRFSFKTLFVILALLVVFEVIQQQYFQGAFAGKNFGNALLVGISSRGNSEQVLDAPGTQDFS